MELFEIEFFDEGNKVKQLQSQSHTNESESVMMRPMTSVSHAPRSTSSKTR